MKNFVTITCLLCLACGSDSSIGGADAPLGADAPVTADARSADGPSPDARLLADGGAVHDVPDPGTGAMPMSWPDTEPNDTPEQAVPLGVGSGQIGPYIEFRGPGGHLGGGDEADYFVFKTSSAPGTTFIANACWDANLHVNLLDFTLYKVVDGQPLIVVDSSNRTDDDCERPQPFWNLALEPDTKYLFALIHVEGEGFYEA